MRIEEMNISGFGLFNQFKVSNLDPCLNIMLGENEAGKSTCLEFVRTLLFGSATGAGARKAPKYPAPAGSEPGGSLIIRTSDNQLLKRTWQPGTGLGKQGLFAIENGDLQARDINDFSQLTGHITRQLYAAVYGFSLDQLQELNSLEQDARVADILYGAGFGLGSISLPQVLSDLEDKQKKGLYTSGGSNQPINKIMARLKALRQEMKQYTEAMPRYNQIEQELAHLKEKLDNEQLELTQTRLFEACLQDLQRLQLSLPKLQQMHLRLNELAPQTRWSDQQTAVLEEYLFADIKSLHLQTNKLQNELNDIALEQAKLGQALGSGAGDISILESGSAIKSLLEEKSHYEALQQELANTSDGLNKLFASPQFISCFGHEFKHLAPNEQQLLLGAQFEKMQAAKDEFGQVQAQWQYLTQTYQPNDLKFGNEQDQPSGQYGQYGQYGPDGQYQLMGQTQDSSLGKSLKQSEAPQAKKLLGLDYRLVIGLELLGFLGVFVWLYNSPQVSPMWMALELGLCLLIVGGLGFKLYNKNRTRQLANEKLKEQKENFKKSRQVLLAKSRDIAQQLWPLLVLNQSDSQQSLLDEDIAALLNQYSEQGGKQVQAALDQWHEAATKLTQGQQLANQLLHLDERAQRLYEQLLGQGANTAFGNGLAADYAPEANTPKSFLAIIQELESRLNKARQVQLEQSKINGQVASFSKQQLAKQPELELAQGKLQAIYAQAKVRNLDELETMYRLWEEKVELSKSIQKLQTQLVAEAEDIFCKLSGQLPANQVTFERVISGQVTSGQEISSQQISCQVTSSQAVSGQVVSGQEASQVQNLQNLFTSMLAGIFSDGLPTKLSNHLPNQLPGQLPGQFPNDSPNQLPGQLASQLPGQPVKEIYSGDDLLTLLQAIPREKLSLEKERISQHTQTLEELIKEKIKEQGALRQQASALMSEDRLTALAFEESALQEELNVLSRKWAVAALAKHFTLQAKTAFEQEHQTAVMSGASKFFNQITNGAYQGLDPSATPGSFAVLTPQGESRMPEQLSRGTREQLYLALRLALIEERTSSLPKKEGQQLERREQEQELEQLEQLEEGQIVPYLEPLPLIMDDVLVNFDPQRTKRAIKSILTLASRHQIFYFTCQPHMRPLLCEQAEISNCSYKCFKLAGGQITPA